MQICRYPIDEEHLEVRKCLLQLKVQICNNMLKDSTVAIASYNFIQYSRNEREKYLTKTVIDICIQIRAMDKDMRRYCADLLKTVKDIPVNLILQMVEKEASFQQKFVQIGVQQQSTTGSKSKQKREGKDSSFKQFQSQKNHDSKDSVTSADLIKQQQISGKQEDHPVITEIRGILLLLLEDDSMVVRLSGINTMSHFANQVKDIRPRCLNFLIDMLNDEIDEVRTGALHGIAFFNEISELKDSEVNIVLFNLTEDNQRLRDEIYRFFGMTIITKPELFQKLLNKLFENLRAFGKKDQHQIFQLLKELGNSHSQLVEKMFNKILGIDKRFQAIDPIWTDIIFVAKMILVYSASQQIPQIFYEAPSFVEKSLNYLKDQYRQYFTVNHQNLNQDSNSIVNELEFANIFNQIKDLIGQKQLKPIIAISLNSYKVVKKVSGVNSSANDQKLAIIYMITKLIKITQANQDGSQIVEFIQNKIRLLSSFLNSPEQVNQIANYLSSINYFRMVRDQLQIQESSDIFYDKKLIECCERLIEYITPNQRLFTDLQQISQLIQNQILSQKQNLNLKENRQILRIQLDKLISGFDIFNSISKFLQQLCDVPACAFRYLKNQITHPITNKYDAYSFSCKHSDFITIQGVLADSKNSQSMLVVRYPDERIQMFSIGACNTHKFNPQTPPNSNDKEINLTKHYEQVIKQQNNNTSSLQNSITQFSQQIELRLDKSWSTQDFIEIFTVTNQNSHNQQIIDENEKILIQQLVGQVKLQQIDNAVAKLNGEKIIIVSSNVQKYLIKPVN
eukprot:403355867